MDTIIKRATAPSFPAGIGGRLLAFLAKDIFNAGRQAWRDAGSANPDWALVVPQEAAPAAAPVDTARHGGPLFSLRGIGKTFDNGVRALADIDLDIREGEIFGIIGRSGAGKSTLLRTLNLLERPTHGAIAFDGRDLLTLNASELRPLRRRIGMIFQHFNLLSSRTIAGNIALPLELVGTPKAQIDRRVAELLDLVGLPELGDRYPTQISGGQKQRVGIARALATEPRVLLCDEATSALDPETTQAILALLADINRRLGLTIVLITHQMQVIKAVADRVAVLDHGLAVEFGDVAEIFTAPRTAITRSLLREVIGDGIPDSVRERLGSLATGRNNAVWRLTFSGEVVDTPLLAELSTCLPVSTHLLHGYIDEVRGRPFASLLTLVTGAADSLAAAADFLRRRGVRIEEVPE